MGIFVFLCSCTWYRPSFGISVLLMFPLLVDGFFQLLTSYESKNVRRFVTGLLFGYALTNLFAKSILLVYQAGNECEMRRSENTVLFIGEMDKMR